MDKENKKIAIVVPAHIPLTETFVDALKREARHSDADVFIVDDSNGNLNEMSFPADWKVFDYKKQEEFLEELYEDFAKIFHKSSACKNFGHIWAYANGYDVIIGLDSDCIVPLHFVEDHLATLNTERNSGWANPLAGSRLYPRGFPYSIRNWKTVGNMGMWDNVLDMNGKDRFKSEPKRINVGKYNAVAPIPFSGMNFAIVREAIFGFLFLPNFNFETANITEPHKFRRIDDIWGGYIFQKLLNKLHLGVTYGQPIVYHDTVVIAHEDAKEEEAMYKFEDSFIENVDFVISQIFQKNLNDSMSEFCVRWDHGKEFKGLIPAFDWWRKVIEKYATQGGKSEGEKS